MNLTDLHTYALELENELQNILGYWQKFAVDHINGGFAGKISNSNTLDPKADKGAVLNARILWSFSAGYAHTQEPAWLALANRAFHYLSSHFIDHEFGGVYWTVDFKGEPLDTKKQVYATAFAIYAFSEYYKVSKNEEARSYAIQRYKDLVKHSYDQEQQGYFEAFARDWTELADLRLSDKDANEKKSMNTHLHVLEGFANLYQIWPDEGLKIKIISLLDNFHTHIVDPETNRLILFFDEQWNRRSAIISYGHDIEAAWLILEAAEIIGEQQWIDKSKVLAVNMALACRAGLDPSGSLWYENDLELKHLVKEKHWWVQAESMVGFFNAWQLSGNKELLTISLNNWKYVKQWIIDHENGEWFWGRTENNEIMHGEDKAGLWKCPYHNSRACLEIIRRIGRLQTA